MKTNTKMMFLLQKLNYQKEHLVLNCWCPRFESRWMSVELVCYVKTIIAFYKFYELFCRRHSLMNPRYCNNLFHMMQLSKLKRVIFTQWKHLESRVNVFWYCFKAIKQYAFCYLTKSVPTARNKSSFEILQLFDTWCCQNLVILFFSSVVALI